jgi:heptaprenyl diphosphate synthase
VPLIESPLLRFPDPTLEAELQGGLAAVEAMLREAVKSHYPFVTDTSRHLVAAGGKRFRPLLVLVAAQFGDAGSPGVVPGAVAVELTHLSTLYHDDVMDEAALRRGAASANSRWNNTVAILTGDFLFARASEITAELGTEATRILSRTIATLCEGQIRESVGPSSHEDPIQHYLQVVAEKTGSLIATSGRFGGLLSGADPGAVEALTRFGKRFGVAFQVSDDLIDVTGRLSDTGKAPGTDLREGVRTLPVLYTLRAGGSAGRRLAQLLGDGPLDDRRVAEGLDLVCGSPGLQQARSTLYRLADEARDALAPLSDLPARRALEQMCDFVVHRTR